MPVGLEVFNPQGALRVSLTTPMARVIETFTVGGQTSGSKTYTVNNNIHAVCTAVSGYLLPPKISVSGKTVSWVPSSSTSGSSGPMWGDGLIIVFTL